MIKASQIKELRDQTGLSFSHCKQALEEAAGDLVKAKEILKAKGAAVAEKKAARALGAGRVAAYIHHGGLIGALVELRAETDFVAKSPDFQNLADDLAMQIAATAPADAAELLSGPFIKEPSETVAKKLEQAIHKFGERIEVSGFSRFDASL